MVQVVRRRTDLTLGHEHDDSEIPAIWEKGRCWEVLSEDMWARVQNGNVNGAAAMLFYKGDIVLFAFDGDLYDVPFDVVCELIERDGRDEAMRTITKLILNLGDSKREEMSRALAMAEARLEAPSSQRQAIPDSVKIFVWQRDGGQCVSCGSKAELEYDHIIPVSMGGSNTSRNLQLLCEPCNRKKGGNLA